MKAIITKKSILIASTALLLAIITLVSVNAFSTPGPITGFANFVTAPVRAIASAVAQTFESIYASIYRYEDLERRYDILAARYAQLLRDQHEAVEIAEENERLRALHGFGERAGGLTHEMATVQSRGSDNFTSTFVINRGYANSPVRSGMGVATEYGFLIGQVTDVSATTATVITILDTTFAATAFVGEAGNIGTEGGSGVSATATGSFNFMRDGLLILDYIDESISLLSGASVITSGQGGVFPPGLIVGEIENVFPHPSGIGRFATIRPMREIGTINNVFVITSFESVEEGVGFETLEESSGFDTFDADIGFEVIEEN